MEWKLKLFADDTQFYFSIYDIDDTTVKLNNILLSVREWMDFKQLKLNENKTEYMIVGSKNRIWKFGNINMKVNENQVQIADKVRDLGVILDCNLSLNAQINNVFRIAGNHLRNIAFIKKYIDESSVKKRVINCVINIDDYCNSIYCNLPKILLKKLQKKMNRAARLIKGISPRDRITPVLIELHWLPIKARIKCKICVLAHQALHTGCPSYLRDLLHVIQPSESINTRRATVGLTLLEPRLSSGVGFRAFKSAAPRFYNSLPLDIRRIEDTKSFKNKLKTFLFSECYDLEDSTINEGYALWSCVESEVNHTWGSCRAPSAEWDQINNDNK